MERSFSSRPVRSGSVVVERSPSVTVVPLTAASSEPTLGSMRSITPSSRAAVALMLVASRTNDSATSALRP